MSWRRLDDPAALRRKLQDAEYDAQEMRDQLERERDRHAQEERERRQALREQREMASRRANDWRDALVKQIGLINQELRRYPEEDGDSLFSDWLTECQRALTAWDDLTPAFEAEIAPLLQQIAEARTRFMDQVAEAAGPQIAEAFTQFGDDPSGWLNW